MSGERRIATLLFADIVASAATGATSDLEIVRAHTSLVLAEMRKVPETNDRTVKSSSGS